MEVGPGEELEKDVVVKDVGDSGVGERWSSKAR